MVQKTKVEMFNNGYDSESSKPVKIKPSNPSQEPAEKTTSNSFRKLLKNFASDTSFGGISKVVFSESHIRRVLWFLISATCYGFTIYMCILLIQTYLKKPIKTAVDIVYEKNIDFPSVTVCNLNQFRKSILHHEAISIADILKSYSDEKRNKSDGSQFEKDVDKQTEAFKKDFSNDIDDENEDISDISIDEDVLIEQLVAIEASHYDAKDLEMVGHQFGDMILSCSWKGLNCLTGYFKQFWVKSWNWKYGNCFTFNPGGNETGHRLNVFRTSKPGPNYGLSLDIDIEQQEYVDELTDEAGVNVIIHNARQMPFPYDEGITVPPGFSSSIAIRQERITRVDPFNNGSCNPSTILPTNNIYNTYMKGSCRKYSVKACMESCLATEQHNTCNCSEAKFSLYVKSTCYELEQLECLSTVSNAFKNSQLGCNDKCPQPCEHQSYRHTTMISTLTSKEKETRKKKDFGDKHNKTDFDFDDNFLRVKIFYDELNLQKIVQSTYYDLETLLGDIGGQLGLWIGISVISVAEFGELLFSLCVVGVRKSRDKKKTRTSEMELR